MNKKIVKKVVKTEKKEKVADKIEVSRVLDADSVIITYSDGSQEKRAM